jgi:hypothetical protein
MDSRVVRVVHVVSLVLQRTVGGRSVGCGRISVLLSSDPARRPEAQASSGFNARGPDGIPAQVRRSSRKDQATTR